MSEYLPEAVRKGLEDAHKQSLRRSDRLCVHDGDNVHAIRRFWEGGFALDVDVADTLRGHIDIYDGARHLYQCLVISAVTEGDARVFEFKRMTHVHNRAPADFVHDGGFVPAALLN